MVIADDTRRKLEMFFEAGLGVDLGFRSLCILTQGLGSTSCFLEEYKTAKLSVRKLRCYQFLRASPHEFCPDLIDPQ